MADDIKARNCVASCIHRIINRAVTVGRWNDAFETNLPGKFETGEITGAVSSV